MYCFSISGDEILENLGADKMFIERIHYIGVHQLSHMIEDIYMCANGAQCKNEKNIPIESPRVG